MDIKSMAKSKRSHTQHHQPRKPHIPPKSSSSSSSSSLTSAIKKDGGDKKKTKPNPPSLPSNWDRYEDEDDVHGSNAKMGVDFNEVKPKSKGADFTDLIAQAQESRTYYSPSSDDKLPDFYQGAAPMLAAREGKLILEDRDDDFLMEDEAGGNPEAPFLTLDLEDLAEQLSKIDLAERLFIESDLLPPELRQDAHEADNQVPFWKPERPEIPNDYSFDELLALYLEEERMAKTKDEVEEHGMRSSSDVSSCHDSKADADVTKSMSNMGFSDAREALQVNHAGEKDANSKLDDVGQVDEITKQTTKSSLKDLEFHNGEVMAQNVKEQDTALTSRFEAAAAEEELDLLLGSFTETKLFDIPVSEPGTSTSTKASLQHSMGQPAPTFPVTTSLDDELDDLLAITTDPNNNDGQPLSQSFQAPSSSSQPISKSMVLEDFDSWLDTL